jgi:hypothetical protein
MPTLDTPGQPRRYRRGPLTLVRTVVPLRPAGRTGPDGRNAHAASLGVLRDGDPFGGDAA